MVTILIGNETRRLEEIDESWRRMARLEGVEPTFCCPPRPVVREEGWVIVDVLRRFWHQNAQRLSVSIVAACFAETHPRRG